MEIVKNPVSALMKAKKSKNMNYTITTLVIAAILFALSSVIVLFNVLGITAALAVATFITVFLSVIVVGLLFGLLLHIITKTLGGKGDYFEGLTTITYALIAPSIGFLITAILMFVPWIGTPIGVIVLALTLAHGISLLYRGVKELYKVDMVTSLVVISVLIMTIVFAMWMGVGFTALNLASMNIGALGVF